MVAGPRCSVRRRSFTTRASSIGDRVRGGRLASSRATFSSTDERSRSTMTGTCFNPSCRQRARRLNPSTSS